MPLFYVGSTKDAANDDLLIRHMKKIVENLMNTISLSMVEKIKYIFELDFLHGQRRNVAQIHYGSLKSDWMA